MGRAPSLVLKREDYEEVEGDWIDKLIRNLNLFTKQTTACLTRGLTFGENGNAFLKEMEIPGDVSANKPVKFQNSLPAKTPPVGIVVISAKDGNGNPVSVGSAPWQATGGTDIAIVGPFQGQSGKMSVNLLVIGG